MASTSTSTVVVSFRTTRPFRHLLRAAAEAEDIPVAHLVERLVRQEVGKQGFRLAASAEGEPRASQGRRA